MTEEFGSALTIRPTEKKHMDNDFVAATLDLSSDTSAEQESAATTSEYDAVGIDDIDARLPLPPLTSYPPLPSGLAPIITPDEPAMAAFVSRGDFMRFLA